MTNFNFQVKYDIDGIVITMNSNVAMSNCIHLVSLKRTRKSKN